MGNCRRSVFLAKGTASAKALGKSMQGQYGGDRVWDVFRK